MAGADAVVAAANAMADRRMFGLAQSKKEKEAVVLPDLTSQFHDFGLSGRCAGGLAAANVVTTIFGNFFFSFLLSAVAFTPEGIIVGF